MDAADMFDGIHVLYEEDITPRWEQHIDVKDRIREAIYPLLYDRPYLFSNSGKKGQAAGSAGPGGGSFQGSGPDGFPEGVGDTREIKPYIPPTEPEDLTKVLGQPIGG